MNTDGNGTTVNQSIEIKAPVEQIWKALIAADVRADWWSYLDLDPVVGGGVKETWEGPDGSNQTTGVITDLIEGKLLALDWADDGWPESTHVEFMLRPSEGGTLVQLRETGIDRLPGAADIAAEHRAGWQMHLNDLRNLVEGRQMTNQ
ncbi:SRPBCC domain-containing protein [Micromonospora sp. STR1s_5]|nr:SRPBCC domain-containing protein [Micromonospora sp. STR1s_5]